jgi:hypothetical protein
MNRGKIGASIAILTFSLSAASVASAGSGDVLGTPTDPPPPPRGWTLVGGGPVPSTTCGGAISCGLLKTACGLAGGTYSEWHSSDHGHTHGICTWPWE